MTAVTLVTDETTTPDLDVAMARLVWAANLIGQSKALRRNLGELHAILADLGAVRLAIQTHQRLCPGEREP